MGNYQDLSRLCSQSAAAYVADRHKTTGDCFAFCIVAFESGLRFNLIASLYKYVLSLENA